MNVRDYLPRPSRTMAIVVPLHVVAFLLLYFGMVRLVKQELLRGHSASAEVFARVVVEDLHLVMVSERPKTIEEGLAAFSSAHEQVKIVLYDVHGHPLTDRPVPPLKDPEAYGFRIVHNDGRWSFEGELSVVSHEGCTNCHPAGQQLGVAGLSYDLTPFMKAAQARMRRNLAFLVVGWAALVGLITLATRGLVRRRVVQMRADAASSERPTRSGPGVPSVVLDPVSSYLYKTLEEMVRSQRQREEQVASRLHHTDRLASLGQLAAGLAHEIKNPLAGIQGALEILRDETSEEDKRELFQQMLTETGRVNATVQSLLQFARPSRPQRVPTDIGRLLEDTIQLLAPGFRRRKVSVTSSIVPGLPAFSLDPAQIRQVLVNLANNAAEAMEGGGTIVLRATAFPNGEGVIIAVEDDGPGMPPEVREHIFEPFFTTKRLGTGLGLTVVRGLVEQHGGEIEVSSEPGEGSLFMVLLPDSRLPVEVVRGRTAEPWR